MGRCIISLQTGGGGLDTEELTALPEHVEKGKIAGVHGYDDPMVGTLLNLTEETATSYAPSEEDSPIPVLAGTEACVAEDSDKVVRAQILFSGQRGVLEPDTFIGIPQETMALAGGLTQEKLLTGQSAFGLAGTATSDATAASGDILVTKTAYAGGVKMSGEMPNHGAVNKALNCGAAYTIPAGYHNGLGKVTANNLASQTKATAAAGDIVKAKTAYVNGALVTGTMEVQSVLSFSAAPTSATQITCTWKNPAKGPFSGVIIIGKTGSYPTSITDGTRYYKGYGNNSNASGSSTQIISKLSPNTKYYFKAFSYSTKSGSEWIAATSRNATATTPVAKGTQNFTSSGTFTVPDGVTKIDVFCVGGGGGGHSSVHIDSQTFYGGGGGGGGYTTTKKSISVKAGNKYTIIIGAGGYGGNAGSNQKAAIGGDTSFGTLVTAKGGGTPDNGDDDFNYSADSARGARGGSGGGGSYGKSYTAGGPGSGGSDGSAGRHAELYTYVNPSYSAYSGGAGQEKTTRAFEESSGTLYSGGGGGAWPNYGKVKEDSSFNGAGGSGGGGHGGKPITSGFNNTPQGTNGSANTGGGGGGSSLYQRGYTTGVAGSYGGTGICLIRWGY